MARLIGGVAASHTPTIGFAHDGDKRHDPVWAPIFEAFAPVKQWLKDQQPDVVFTIYNDHISSFFFDHYSAFALGMGDEWQVADEGGGARDLPTLAGHPALANHIAHALMAEEFDLSSFQRKPLDHGCFSPLSVLFDHEGGWPTTVIPLQVGVLQLPIPTARRCFKLGQALRRAIESYPEDLRVVVLATGGLSHQVHGERCGFNNTAWDAEFLRLLAHDPETLCNLTHAQYAELGGMEGAEVIMWLIMRGALSPQVRELHQAYYLPSMTGIATTVYEDLGTPPDATTLDAYRAQVGHQLAGAERLTGTYPYTFERSRKGYNLNRFLHGLTVPAQREAFLRDEAVALRDAELSDVERQLVRERDWRGMIHHGVVFFVLEKLAAVVGQSNLHVYAAMRGETLADFLKTRNAPSAIYSVAAQGDKR